MCEATETQMDCLSRSDLSLYLLLTTPLYCFLFLNLQRNMETVSWTANSLISISTKKLTQLLLESVSVYQLDVYSWVCIGRHTCMRLLNIPCTVPFHSST